MLDIIDRELFGIITLTLRMTLLSTAIASVIGIPLGLWLDRVNFAGKKFVVIINRTLMASPPVVIGLVVYLLLMRNGPFGFLGLLFTFQAMVIAQVILLTPIICGIVYTASQRNASNIRSC
jgi:tungstate transport system permease protein